MLLDPYFSASKVAWLLDHVDGAREKAANNELAFGTVDSFILAHLTGGVHATDATNASRTSLYNIVENRWDDDLLSLFNVPASVLPEVRDSMSEFGETTPAIFGRAVPIFSMIGDQQSAAVGQNCLSPGDIKSTYGTGCFVLANTGETMMLSKNRMLSTIALRLDGKTTYALEGSIFIAGAAIQWLRDSLQIIDDAVQSEALARSIEDTGGVYLVPAFAGLGAPHWAAEARGLICGLSRGSGRAEIVRAALESVVYQTADLLGAMANDNAGVTSLKVDGGMVANDWLLQFLSDILDIEVERPKVLETTALGAAYLAGVKAGVYDSLAQATSSRMIDRTFKPSMTPARRDTLTAGWHSALDRTLRP